MMGRSSDFEFSEERSIPVHRLSFEDDESFEFHVGASSSPETSNLLPENRRSSCLSPTSRLRAIMDGRREMMEMIKNMPESSYELTLKDIVDKEAEEEEEEEEEEKGKGKRESISIHKSKQICRSESMESEVFLIKMFLPVSLSFKKKKKKKKKRKCVKQESKDWWKIIFLAIRDHKYKNSNIITDPTSQKKCKKRGERGKGCLF